MIESFFMSCSAEIAATRVRASGSIPAVFAAGVHRQGRMLVDDGFADKVQLDPMKAIKSGPGQLNSFAPGRCRRRFPGRSFGSGSRARQSPFPNQRKIDVRLQVGSRSCHALLRNKRASRTRPRTGRLVHSVPRSCRGNGNPAMGSGRLTTQHRFADTPFGKASLYALARLRTGKLLKLPKPAKLLVKPVRSPAMHIIYGAHSYRKEIAPLNNHFGILIEQSERMIVNFDPPSPSVNGSKLCRPT